MGDFEDCGFCDSNGYPLTDRSMTSEEIQESDVEQWEEPGDLYDCIYDAINLGVYDPSSSHINSNTWFSSVDGDVDYLTGIEKRYSLHIDGLSNIRMQKIAEILASGGISSNDEEWLKALDGDYSDEMVDIQDVLEPIGNGMRYTPFIFTKGDVSYTLSIQPPGLTLKVPNPKTLNNFEIACWEDGKDYEFPDFIHEKVKDLGNICPIRCNPDTAQAIYDAFVIWTHEQD
jgi:hypothetical protein